MFNNILFHSQNRLTLPKSKGFGRLYNWYAASSRSLGMLYNWYAATDVRNIAPVGWHVPSREEYEQLSTYIGGLSVAGGKLKEIGDTYWTVGNTDATNELGFNLCEIGDRSYTSGFFTKNGYTYLWTNTSYTESNGILYVVKSSSINAEINQFDKKDGCTLRLLKDDSTDTGIMTGNDGNQYATVKIGTQVWMSENLEETKFRNGDTIPVVTDNAAWTALTTAGSCWYNNTRTYNLAPVGWHLPNLEEYTTLQTYLGGGTIAGGKLKEIGTEHWNAPNTGATNESGFTALGNGSRTNGWFSGILQNTGFYMSTVQGSTNGNYLALFYNDATSFNYSTTKTRGYSVRFIRNINSVLTTQPIDTEGNIYETVTIGTQTLTRQNHKSKKWRTGENINIQDVYTANEWNVLTIPACCAYNNDENNV